MPVDAAHRQPPLFCARSASARCWVKSEAAIMGKGDQMGLVASALASLGARRAR